MAPNGDSKTPPSKLDEVKVNNASLTELKLACDDALRRYLSKPEHFKIQHSHRYTSGTRIRWCHRRCCHGLCHSVYAPHKYTTLYSYFIEGETVFVGKRKTVNKRIETERLTIGAKTAPSDKAQSAVGPRYSLNAAYVHTANNGKSLIRKSKQSTEAPILHGLTRKGGWTR
ncbi:hypothetical protein RhiJN_19426 [Ceratobasidium sp. AG-Ba]|nr:hypothetical protein RhiJN_19426 [Ceratobasidium sp. AG-Ba]